MQGSTTKLLLVSFTLSTFAISSNGNTQTSTPDVKKPLTCHGIISDDPKHMYDFKLGDWDLHWKNKTANGGFAEFEAVSEVHTIMDGDISIDEQTAKYFKGITFRTYDATKSEWVVRWLPANSTWEAPLSAKLEDCVPVERHHQKSPLSDNTKVRTQFTDITANSFKFRQDWSTDDGKTWTTDVLYYEATRKTPVSTP